MRFEHVLAIPRAVAPARRPGVRRPGKRLCSLVAAAVLVTPGQLWALEIRAGASLGAMQHGTAGYFGAGPHLGFLVRQSAGTAFSILETLLFLPTSHGLGVNSQVSVGGGYGGERFTVTAGGLLAIYRAFTCGRSNLDSRTRCGTVMGIGPGGFAQMDYFVQERLGFMLRGTIAWQGGDSLLPASELAWSALAGPVLRWGNEK